jgi:hypothetical protein
MLLIVMCWTRESPIESTNQTVTVTLLYTKILCAIQDLYLSQLL